MPKPVFESKTNNRLRVYMIGHQPKRFNWPEAKADLNAILGEDPGSALLAVTASTSKDEGFGQLKSAVFNSSLRTDGIVYNGNEPATFMFQTADCPCLIIQDEDSGKLVIAHCGKPALRPCSDHGCGNMVSTAISRFKECDPVKLSVYITAGICGSCYTHEQDLSHTTPFYNRIDHGEDRTKGELNLIRRIKHELRHEGIPESNFEIDWRCTKETPDLSSHRRGDGSRNTIIVMVS